MMVAKSILAAAVLTFSHAEENEYGVDTSFPIHHTFVGHESAAISETLKKFGSAKINLYHDYIKGCENKYRSLGKAAECRFNENERLRLNIDQPSQMTNYTDGPGFKKVRLSDPLWSELRNLWEGIMGNGGIEGLEEEYWPEANTYTNHWASPSRMRNIHGGLHESVYGEIEERVREWIPDADSFSRSSMYGIRVYVTGSILATHVDRDPLITSAIINVGQDLDEEWPLEVYDHNGQAHNITMEPGDVVLYESHSVLHGRPFPLKGKYYANIFVHFKPIFPPGHHWFLGEDGASEGEL